MESDLSGTFVPPYNIPWATFLSAVEKISADPPNRVDRSYLGSQSGNVQTYLIAALKAFGLIDQDARPTRINDFADAGSRKEKMGDLLREHYPTLVALGQTKATNDELREKFGEAFPGITGESRVKAIRFFLSGMNYAELPVSDLWSSVKAPRGASARTTTPRKTAARKNNNGGDSGPPASTPAAADMRRAYFDLLVDKAKTEGDKTDLLDRIERLIGIETGPAKKAEATDQDRGGAS